MLAQDFGLGVCGRGSARAVEGEAAVVVESAD
jgi:hypothetical protein